MAYEYIITRYVVIERNDDGSVHDVIGIFDSKKDAEEYAVEANIHNWLIMPIVPPL